MAEKETKQTEISEIDFNEACDSAMKNLGEMSKGCREIERLCNRIQERFFAERARRKGNLQWITLYVVVIGMISTKALEPTLSLFSMRERKQDVDSRKYQREWALDPLFRLTRTIAHIEIVAYTGSERQFLRE